MSTPTTRRHRRISTALWGRSLDYTPIYEPSMEEILESIRRIIDGDCFDAFDNIEDFRKYLAERKTAPEEPYGLGMFTREVTVITFRKDRNGENILADIKAANDNEGHGNVKIPNTHIEIINYSYCPQCGEVHTMMDLEKYYFNPTTEPGVDRRTQYRYDTRVSCKVCKHYFLPAMVIADGTPIDESQFLCRTQTITGIEDFMKPVRPVLSKDRSNILYRKDQETGVRLSGIRNDVRIGELKAKPALVTNLLQYTPPDLMLNLIQGKNVANDDVVFGTWFPT